MNFLKTTLLLASATLLPTMAADAQDYRPTKPDPNSPSNNPLAPRPTPQPPAKPSIETQRSIERQRKEVHSFFVGYADQRGNGLYKLWGLDWHGRVPVIPPLFFNDSSRNALYDDPQKAQLANLLGFEAGFNILRNGGFDVQYTNKFNTPYTGPVYQHVDASWRPSMAYGEFHLQYPISDEEGDLKVVPSLFAGLEFAPGSLQNTVNFYSATRLGAEIMVQFGADTKDKRRKGITAGVRALWERPNKANTYWFNRTNIAPLNPVFDHNRPSFQFFIGIDLNQGKNVNNARPTSAIYHDAENNAVEITTVPEEKIAYWGEAYKMRDPSLS